MNSLITNRIAYTLASAAVMIAGTLAAIQYAKGDFRITKSGLIQNTGLLAANSFPTGAEVYVNDKLVTATDDTLYLEPGTYEVKIAKEGYSAWKKTLRIEKELVTQTNAQLFPLASSLSPLTFSGANNVLTSPDGQKILFYTDNAISESKNGLYVLELANNPLPLQRGARQISEESNSFDLSQANYIWSPDSNELLVSQGNRDVLIETNRKTSLGTQTNISAQKRIILGKWQEEMYIRERQFLAKFPEEIVAIATQSAKNVYLSPDKDKMLYTATQAVSIPDSIVAPLPATNTQKESRNLEPGKIYVYDSEEDKNFLIGQEETSPEIEEPNQLETLRKNLLATDLFTKSPLTFEASPSAFYSLQKETAQETAQNFAHYHTPVNTGSFQWFPDSSHLIYTNNNEIHIVGYDGTNDTVVYSGPFEQDFVYPWPDGSRLVILTSFSPNSPANLYSIELR